MTNFKSIFWSLLIFSISIPSYTAEMPTVVVTGGNRGLGFVWVQKYAARGWNVIATARNPSGSLDLQAFAKLNKGVRIEQLDVTDSVSVDALAKRLVGQPVDILINNVGMLGDEQGQHLGSLDPALFDAYMRVNALGALLVTEALMPNILASEQKKVAGISAVAASFAAYPRMHHGLYYYKASKVALNMIMLNIALDGRPNGVAVAVLSPGVVKTSGEEMDRDGMSPEMLRSMTDIDTSVNGMMAVMDNLTLNNSGKWYRFDGTEISW